MYLCTRKASKASKQRCQNFSPATARFQAARCRRTHLHVLCERYFMCTAQQCKYSKFVCVLKRYRHGTLLALLALLVLALLALLALLAPLALLVLACNCSILRRATPSYSSALSFVCLDGSKRSRSSGSIALRFFATFSVSICTFVPVKQANCVPERHTPSMLSHRGFQATFCIFEACCVSICSFCTGRDSKATRLFVVVIDPALLQEVGGTLAEALGLQLV